MKVAIHQPHYMPWLGYLRKMREADIFVYLDNANYTKNGFINRNRIMINSENHWLTIPVLTKGKTGQAIKDIEVNWDKDWKRKHYYTLLFNYSKDIIGKTDALKDFFNRSDELLIDWCLKSIRFLCLVYRVSTECVCESKLIEAGDTGSERLANICRTLGADTYLSGPSGRGYLDEKAFGDIKVEYLDWKPCSSLSALHFYIKDEIEMLGDTNG